jgi:hypothetical protein
VIGGVKASRRALSSELRLWQACRANAEAKAFAASITRSIADAESAAGDPHKQLGLIRVAQNALANVNIIINILPAVAAKRDFENARRT